MAASTPMSAVPRPRISTSTQFWMTRAGYGFMLGATVALLEFAYYFPLVTMRTEIGLSSIGNQFTSFAELTIAPGRLPRSS
jgi:hypothetical protein